MNLEYLPIFSSVGFIGLLFAMISGVISIVRWLEKKPVKIWLIILGLSLLMVVVGFCYAQLKVFEIYNID